MLPEELLHKLKEQNIGIGVVDGKLKVVDPDKNLNPELLGMLKENKQALIDFLSRSSSFTRSDFPHAKVSEDELKQIAKDHPKLEKLYQATPIQQGMLFEEKASTGNHEYVMQFFSEIKGGIKADIMRQAWDKLVARHDVFRTGFVGFDQEVINQFVETSVSLPWTEQDLTDKSAEEQQQAIAEFLQQDEKQGFDYEKPPLMRVAVLKLSELASFFVWTYHHTLLDGWSLPVILAELLAYYHDIATGTDSELPNAVQFGDYAAWLAQQDNEKSEAFWKEYLAGITKPTPVMHNSSKPKAPVSDKHEHVVRLPVAATTQLVETAKQAGTTVFTALQMAWGSLLARYNNLDDVVFGTTVSGRPPALAGVEQIAGVFINTLPVRLNFAGNPTVGQALANLHQQNGVKDEHTYFPLAEIKALSDLDTRDNMLDNILVYYNLPPATEASDAASADKPDLEVTTEKLQQNYNFPLTVKGTMLSEDQGELIELVFEFDKNYYPADAMGRMADNFITLLTALGASSDSDAVSSLFNTIDGKELSAQLTDTQSSATDLVTQIEQHSSGDAIYTSDGVMSYAELNEKASQIAALLAEKGISGDTAKDKVIAVSMERSPLFAATLLGILKAGAAYTLIDWSLPATRNQQQLDVAGVAMIITQRTLADLLPLDNHPVIMINEAKFPAAATTQSVSSDALAAVKVVASKDGVMRAVGLTRQNLTASASNMNDAFGATRLNRTLCSSIYASALFESEFWAPLTLGGTTLLVEDVYEVCLDAALQPTFINLMTDSYKELVKREYGFSGVKAVNFTADGADTATIKQVYNRTDIEDVFASMAFVETSGVAAVASFPKGSAGFDTDMVGKSVSAQTRLLPVYHQQLQHQDMMAELCVAGPAVAQGYLNQTENGFTTIDGQAIYHTGERVVVTGFDAEGQPNLRRAGRLNRQTHLRGQRVEPQEIEHLLKAGMDEIVKCAVIKREDAGTGQRLVVYVEMTHFIGYLDDFSDNTLYYDTVAKCKSVLQAALPPALVPDFYVFLEALPLLATGDVNLAALPSPEAFTKEMRQYVAPNDEFEQTIHDFWENVFHIREISVHNDFFELGGTSMQQTRIQANINKTWDLELTIEEIFENPTIAAIADLIKAQLKETESA